MICIHADAVPEAEPKAGKPSAPRKQAAVKVTGEDATNGALQNRQAAEEVQPRGTGTPIPGDSGVKEKERTGIKRGKTSLKGKEGMGGAEVGAALEKGLLGGPLLELDGPLAPVWD